MKTTLEEGQVEMKRWHFDQTKGYIKALDATYVRIRQLEDQIKEEELNDDDEQKNKMEVAEKLENDEITPIGKLFMKGKEVIEEPMTRKKHKDTTTWMETKWIETRN